MKATSDDAPAIEVLSGLDPVRKRPGMYTDTTRPNHLAQEVIDNSVDEAIAPHATVVAVSDVVRSRFMTGLLVGVLVNDDRMVRMSFRLAALPRSTGFPRGAAGGPWCAG